MYPVRLVTRGHYNPLSCLLRTCPASPLPACSAYLGVLGPVERAGSVARILAVDLVAVHADDHFSTPGRERDSEGALHQP